MIGAIYLVQSLQSCKFCRVNTQRIFSPSLVLHCQYHFNVPLVTFFFFFKVLEVHKNKLSCFVDGTLQDIQARNTLNLFLNI